MSFHNLHLAQSLTDIPQYLRQGTGLHSQSILALGRESIGIGTLLARALLDVNGDLFVAGQLSAQGLLIDHLVLDCIQASRRAPNMGRNLELLFVDTQTGKLYHQ